MDGGNDQMDRIGPLPAALTEGRRRLAEVGEVPFAARLALEEAYLAELGPERGRAAWVSLEARAAEHVRAFWESGFPDDRAPYVVLEDALASRDQAATGPSLADRADALYADIVDRHYEASDFRPTYAGFAAWAASRTALDPSGQRPARELTELEIPTEAWDASFYASLAAAGGATWEDLPSDSADQRRRYWEWYLAEAARQADATA